MSENTGPAVGSNDELGPAAWAIFTEDGNARMWGTLQPHLQKLADAQGLTVTPLYTEAQRAAAVAQATELFDQVCEQHEVAAEEVARLMRQQQDLVLLVGRLIRRMRAARLGNGIPAGDDALELQAIGYLQRERLMSPLRGESHPGATQAPQAACPHTGQCHPGHCPCLEAKA